MFQSSWSIEIALWYGNWDFINACIYYEWYGHKVKYMPHTEFSVRIQRIDLFSELCFLVQHIFHTRVKSEKTMEKETWIGRCVYLKSKWHLIMCSEQSLSHVYKKNGDIVHIE